MKKLLTHTLLLFVISVQAQYNQPGTPPAAQAIIDKLVTTDNSTHDSKDLLVSKVGLNKFFARKTGYFLTGEENPSLHRNFLFLDAGDNELVFGHNRYLTRENERIVSVVTYGLKADLTDKFAELMNEDGLNGNFGANLKYTYYLSGGIKYDDKAEWQIEKNTTASGPQKCSMNNKRRLFLADQVRKLRQESIEYEQSKLTYLNDDTKDLCDTKAEEANEAAAEFYKELEKKYTDAYYDKEVELLEDWDAKNLVQVGWVSFSAFLPFTPKSYNVITSTADLPSERKSYLTNGAINFYYLVEHKKTGKWLFNIGATGEWNNSVKNEEMDKYTINELKELGANDSAYIHQKDGDIYYGAYQEYISGKAHGEVTWFPKVKDSPFFTGDWGISAKYEYQFDGLNDKVNLKFGLPFLLKGKDEDSPVNFEVQFKLNDFQRWTTESKKFSIGLSVGLPFSSILY